LAFTLSSSISVVFLQALQQAQSEITEIEQDEAAQCNDESCEIKPQ
jgi:hypothetical protein